MPKLIDCIQGSDEWLECRVGRITASRLAEVMSYKDPSSATAKAAGFSLVREAVAAGIKGDESQDRADYRMDKVAERLTGRLEDNVVSREMKWGIEQEPHARFAYEKARDLMVEQVGFAIHPVIASSGASPDALVESDGVLEIKCPKTTTHLNWMLAGVVPEKHRPQMYWEMVCCERLWADFVSYDPRLPEDLQLFICRLPYDQAIADEMAREVLKFDAEIEEVIEQLRGGRI